MFSQTKRAINARERRVEIREERRFNTLLSDYMKVKYKDIYDECRQMYNSLNGKYPEKHNLTKTKDYKTWKKQTLATNESSDEDKEPITTEPITTATEPITTAKTTEPITTAMTTEPITTATEPITTATEPITSAATRIETVAEGDRANNIGDENENIFEIAMEGHLPDTLENRDEMDDIINNIIRELQQDEDLRNIMHDDELVQPHYMDEDEGIGLNVESELEAILEPFDFDVEVEGFDY